MDMETHHTLLSPPFTHPLHFYPSPISELSSSPLQLNGSKNGPPGRSLSLTSTATSCSADLSVSVPLTPASSDSPTDLPSQNPLHLATSASHSLPNDQLITVKRSRGRPRKHPVKLPDADIKVQKPRSKTGCLTCRKRKKKCDESKPTCLNCEKNGKQCEGYPPFEPWQRSQKSGDSNNSKASPGSMSGVESTYTLPFLNPASPPQGGASDQALDSRLLEHFHSRLIHLLAPKLGESSKLRNFIETLALASTPDGEGVRNCMLALSAAHIIVSFPNFEDLAIAQKYEEAHDQHHSNAMKRLIEALNYQPGGTPNDFTVAQVILMCLHTAVAGDKNGEHRIHLKAGLHLMTNPNTTTDPTFRQLYASLFWFYGVVSAVTVPAPLGDALSPANVMALGNQQQQSSYAGVPSDILRIFLEVSILRQNIRERRKENMSPLCDYPAVHTFHELSSALERWTASESLSPAAKVTSRLYQSCAWVYLLHTVNCSGTKTQNWKSKTDEALNSVHELLATSTTQAILFPLFITGCCSSDPGHRDSIRNAFRQLQLVRSIANVELAGQVVERVWSTIDAGDSQGWDWEGVMSDIALDFLLI